MTINENSGIVMTRKKVDKDAPDVNNSIYNIVIHAIDDGKSFLKLQYQTILYLHVGFADSGC